MFENKTKGWHGSYSVAGRLSAERFYLVLKKDEILKEKIKKIKQKTFFTKEEIEEQELDRQKYNEEQDIFSQTSINDKNKKPEINKFYQGDFCDIENLKSPERYKFHHLHHKDLYKYNKIMKNRQNILPCSTRYNPNKDFVLKRVVTGPKWKEINNKNKNINKKNLKNINNKNDDSPRNDFYITHQICTDITKCVPMEKQNKRGDLPIFNDFRIRTDKAFKPNEINENIEKNSLKKIKHKTSIIPRKIEIPRNNNNNNNKSNTTRSISHEKINFSKNNSSIDFSKNMSREQYYYLHRSRDELHPLITPNFSQVEPRILTMVSFAPKSIGKTNKKRLEGIDANLFFDIDKVLNKVNNHKEVTCPNFDIMVSRKTEGPLPSYMSKNYDRTSLNAMTEKGLKMNNYANVDVKSDYNTFCIKKSFNKMINYDLLKNDKNNNDQMGLPVDFRKEKNMKRFMEFYSTNLDNLDDSSKMFSTSKFDNITLKSDKNNSKNISVYDKDIFKSTFGSENTSKVI